MENSPALSCCTVNTKGYDSFGSCSHNKSTDTTLTEVSVASTSSSLPTHDNTATKDKQLISNSKDQNTFCIPCVLDFFQHKIYSIVGGNITTMEEVKEEEQLLKITPRNCEIHDDKYKVDLDDISGSFSHGMSDIRINIVDEQSTCNSSRSSIPSNELLLYIAFLSFLIFTTLQFFASIYANSQSMMGDSIAMFVDTMTYGFNLCAEKRKKTVTRKERLQLELITPIISVITLVVLDFLVMKDAILTLSEPISSDDEPNPTIMFTFAGLNMLLDAVNIGCFARAKHGLGYITTTSSSSKSSIFDNQSPTALTLTERLVNKSSKNFNSRPNGENDDSNTLLFSDKNSEDKGCDGVARGHHHYHHFNDQNLNMCSAYTHVFADTLRSFAVIGAALVATLDETINGVVSDSIAAIIVSVIIFISVIPLIYGIMYTISELKVVHAEEEMDKSKNASQIGNEEL